MPIHFSKEHWRLGPLKIQKDNLAAPYIPHRPIELDKASQRTMKFICDSLRTCKASHTDCRYVKKGAQSTNIEVIPAVDLPTRLLQIGPNGQSLNLVTTQDLPDVSQHDLTLQGYATLSYCWGGAQPLQLTQQTLTELTHGIGTDRLPQTLRDAVCTTSALGLAHIWIDALCIFQDDPLDTEIEISRMPLYYGANTVTISAESAAACTEGFLNRGSKAFEVGPFEIAFKTKLGYGSIQFYREPMGKVAPIARRGWTLQESMLSRRMVAFSESQAVWCCNVLTIGCGEILSDLTSAIGSFRTSTSNFTIAAISMFPLQDVWDRIVKEFMGRSLGVESDKLLAIGALAFRVIDIAHERKLSLHYLAGLLVNTTSVVSWASELLWIVKPQTGRRPQQYRAPSWSWATLDGSWSHLHIFLPPPYDFRKYHFNFRVTDFKVELHNPRAPYGGVKQAWLVVTGRATRIDGDPRVNVIFPSGEREFLLQEERTVADLLLFCDTVADRVQVESALEGDIEKNDVFLLEIIPPYLEKNTPSVGLILLDNDETESRIGAYVFYFANTQIGKQTYEQFFDGMLEDCRIV